jgi:hypothetical protein
MKRLFLALAMMMVLYCSTVLGSSRIIIPGYQQGTIYVVGVHPNLYGCPLLWFSRDNGATVTPVFFKNDLFFGSMLPDPTSGNFTLLRGDGQFWTSRGGITWTWVNNIIQGIYTSGAMPGEIYRLSHSFSPQLEISSDYGMNYARCPSIGFPTNTLPLDIAVGSMDGEVYASFGDSVFYSADHGRNFAGLFSWSALGISPVYADDQLVSGVESGEIYLFDPRYFGGIKRVSGYGESWSDIPTPPYTQEPTLYPTLGLTTGLLPGELYFYVVSHNMGVGGLMEIWHTTNYGLDGWTGYTHYMFPDAVVDSQIPVPSQFANNFPNPFNPTTTISYQLPANSQVSLRVYDTAGRIVATLVNIWQQPGAYEAVFDGSNLPSGVYVYRLETGIFSATGKMVLMK